MKVAAARAAAFGALMAVERGAWSAEALSSKSTHLDSRDAGLASDIVFGVLRRQGEIDAEIEAYSKRAPEKLDAAVRIAIRMAIYQIRFLDRVPAHAAVNDSVELVRRAGKSSAAAFVNAVLRRALREPIQVAEIKSTPRWLVARWMNQYGEHAAMAIARASLAPPGRFIRATTAPPGNAVATDVPGCYRLDEGSPGEYRFQDIGSQAVVPLLDLKPGQRFLDLCAAPGNKTAQALETPLEAIACDLHLSRARGLTTLNIPVAVIDATRPLPFNSQFDRILVDAPCTGTGTLSRNPEIKWRLQESDVADLQRRQIAILKNALALLKPEGILVYSTCSLEREENEDVIAASGASVLRMMQRIPGRDEGDGFFAAALAAHR
ncbi:MAG TPA: transcription antitermination factor NusB [Bryobacteraceae bacterium]|nr:transcription antitermination factor NusB [Bryobacteraceae bacterium]